MTEPMPTRSIHYQQRWYYVLWVTLLLLATAALIQWERPQSIVAASLVVCVQIRDAPPGAQVQAWTGPRSRWKGLDWSGDGAVPTPLRADGTGTLPLVRVVIARRRWVKDYIPRGTWDLMMLKFTCPGQPPRYFPLSLASDIRLGILRPKWRLTESIGCAWKSLRTDGKPAELNS